MKLHIGCGNHRLDGWVNIDANPACQPDKVMSLPDDSLLLEFDENTVDEIYSSHALEHMPRFLDVVEQMWRVSKPGALWTIEVPHERHEIGNPYHVNRFTEWTFRFFEPTVRFVHPLWGGISRGTANEMNPVALEEMGQSQRKGSIRYVLRVVKN